MVGLIVPLTGSLAAQSTGGAGGIETVATFADLASIADPEAGDQAVVETPPSLWEYSGTEWEQLSPPEVQLAGGYSSTLPTVLGLLITTPAQYTNPAVGPALGAAYSTTAWSP